MSYYNLIFGIIFIVCGILQLGCWVGDNYLSKHNIRFGDVKGHTTTDRDTGKKHRFDYLIRQLNEVKNETS